MLEKSRRLEGEIIVCEAMLRPMMETRNALLSQGTLVIQESVEARRDCRRDPCFAKIFTRTAPRFKTALKYLVRQEQNAIDDGDVAHEKDICADCQPLIARYRKLLEIVMHRLRL